MKNIQALGILAVCLAIGCGGADLESRSMDDSTVPEAVSSQSSEMALVEPVELKGSSAKERLAQDSMKSGQKSPKMKPNVVRKTLSIGSPAPPLDVQHWVDATATPVTDFEPDQVYVVEFWATWCGPCLYSMPHLAKLQNEYRDKGVRIISISNEDVDKVTTFLDRPVPAMLLKDSDASDDESSEDDDAETITYGQLTSAYSLTVDPDSSSNEDYMKAANRNGIPCAFIVGKDAHVEWIGHPMSMDEPLARVVADEWDREEAKTELVREEKRYEIFRNVMTAHRAKKYEEVVQMMKEHQDLFAGSKYESMLTKMKFESLLSTQNNQEVLEGIQRMAAADGDDLLTVNGWARAVFEAVSQDYPDGEEIVNATINALEKAIAASPDSDALFAPLDTLAHLKAYAGDTEAAIELQTRAIDLAPASRKGTLQEYLDELTAK